MFGRDLNGLGTDGLHVQSDHTQRPVAVFVQYPHLVKRAPQVYRSNSSLVIVLQERQNISAIGRQKKRKVTLGEALLYDASQRLECTHSKPIVDGGKIVAAEFFYRVEKNKVDGWTDQDGSFFTSTGEGDTLPGFDRTREAIQEGLNRKIVKQRKKRKLDYIVAQAPGEDEVFLEVAGGKEDLRLYLNEDRNRLEEFIAWLDVHARRLK